MDIRVNNIEGRLSESITSRGRFSELITSRGWLLELMTWRGRLLELKISKGPLSELITLRGRLSEVIFSMEYLRAEQLSRVNNLEGWLSELIKSKDGYQNQ